VNQPSDDVWNSRDFPVLAAVTRRWDISGAEPVYIADVTADLDLPEAEVLNSIRVLSGHGLITTAVRDRRLTGASGNHVKYVSREAYELVGLWPSPEAAYERMIRALEDIAEHSDDDVKRGRAKKLLALLGDSGRQLGISVAAAMISGQVG
jgi:hypothetical protein